jgi:hypothetical protein
MRRRTAAVLLFALGFALPVAARADVLRVGAGWPWGLLRIRHAHKAAPPAPTPAVAEESEPPSAGTPIRRGRLPPVRIADIAALPVLPPEAGPPPDGSPLP